MKNYRSNTLLMVFVVSALLLIGCAKSESTTNRAAAAPPTAAPSTAAPAASPAAPTTTATAIGVPECDAFLKAYEACIHDKVPAAVRPTFETGLANWRKSWHTLAANPQTKGSLATACKSAKDSANTSMKAYGCTF